VANGRKKKCTIFSLEDGDKTIVEEEELRTHIINCYKKLFWERGGWFYPYQ
jgi:hypothetical protein